ncbi:Cytochrome bo(3) ubiquinol oxidase subunit 2 [Candidatus Protochlamydia amoebophila]|nr:Cytochrome bo(3) ubiquinol oxidase subunit 2 [Candidatus Protochlamydia amoebophila]
MKAARKSVFYMLFFTGLILFLILIMQVLEILHFKEFIAILFPEGWIAVKERNLLLIIQALMLLVVVPVYILTFVFSWKYSADNPKGKYDPDLVDNKFAEFIWWGIPLVLIIFLSVLTWVKTAELDPYKPIISDKKEITIQVIALQWKWLFIYPEEKIATINFLQIPQNTPIHFEITADAPMNSFWIPELGGQIYAMPSMQTELYLIANHTGDYRGSSANLSGEGFSGMNFITRSSTEEEYQQWLTSAKQSNNILNQNEYNLIAKPSKNNPVEIYRLEENSLFELTIDKYMYPQKK